ncbi:MAG: hypothetical protein JXR33_00390 [Coriobacteriia bacterium]|nr:hypothetical protein [Coriobacteriia bacterium]
MYAPSGRALHRRLPGTSDERGRVMRWVLPYIDQPPEFWARVADVVAPDTASVYFPMPASPIGSGRPPLRAEHLQAFLGVDGVEKSVLLNPVVHEGPAARAFAMVKPYVRELVEEFGVAEAVVGSLGLARLLREAFPELRRAASTLLDVRTPAQVVYLEGVFDSLTPGGGVMRDLPALRELREAWPRALRLMVNEGCLPGCVYRTQHFFEMNSADPMPASLCAGLLEREPWLVLTGAWVLPQHLDLFEGLYDELKLDGRVTLAEPEHYLRVLSAYAHRTPLDLAEIGGGPATAPGVPPISREFYAHTLTCAKTCASCDVCREYLANEGRP